MLQSFHQPGDGVHLQTYATCDTELSLATLTAKVYCHSRKSHCLDGSIPKILGLGDDGVDEVRNEMSDTEHIDR